MRPQSFQPNEKYIHVRKKKKEEEEKREVIKKKDSKIFRTIKYLHGC